MGPEPEKQEVNRDWQKPRPSPVAIKNFLAWNTNWLQEMGFYDKTIDDNPLIKKQP